MPKSFSEWFPVALGAGYSEGTKTSIEIQSWPPKPEEWHRRHGRHWLMYLNHGPVRQLLKSSKLTTNLHDTFRSIKISNLFLFCCCLKWWRLQSEDPLWVAVVKGESSGYRNLAPFLTSCVTLVELLTSLSLSFLISKIGIRIAPISWDVNGLNKVIPIKCLA